MLVQCENKIDYLQECIGKCDKLDVIYQKSNRMIMSYGNRIEAFQDEIKYIIIIN